MFKLKPKIKRMNFFVRLITFSQAGAITLSPFGIYIKEVYFRWKDIAPKRWDELVNHESIHWKQQLELLIIFFYPLYFIEWIIRLFTNTRSAYKSISFEREANANEDNPNYLNERKSFAWLNYIFKK